MTKRSSKPRSADRQQAGSPGRWFAEGSRSRLALLLTTAGLLLGGTIAVYALRRPPVDAAETYAAALGLIEKDNGAAAAELLDTLLADHPEHWQAMLVRGQLARDLGDTDGALEFWRQVPSHPPQIGGTARYLEGTVMLERSRAREAERLLNESTRLNPDYLQPHERLVELYMAQMRRDEVRRELAHIRRLRPWKLEELVLFAVVAERVTAVEDGVAMMKRFLKADPDDTASAIALARYYVAGDEHDKALELLESWQRKEPTNSRIAGLLAERYLHQGDTEAARQTLARVAQQDDLQFAFWFAAGRYWSLEEDWERADLCFRKAVELDPEDLPSHQQFGLVLQRQGKTDEAKEHLRIAERIDRVRRQAFRIPQRDNSNQQLLVPILFDVAQSLVALERHHEALQWYERVLELAPSHPRAARDYQAALAVVSQRLQKLPDQVADQPAAVPVTAVAFGPLPAAPSDAGSATDESANPLLAPVRLEDVHAAAGLDFTYFSGQTGLKYLVESMGGGAAVLDYDQDGYPDLFFSQGCKLPFDDADHSHLDRLYRNQGDGTFVDVTASTGIHDHRYGQGCAAGDLDNDGYPDLIIANFGQNVVYHNNGDGTFTDITESCGMLDDKWSSSVGLADLDQDGNLDIYMVNYVDSLKVCRADDGRISTCDPQNFGAEQDRLFHNQGDGTFVDVTESSGIVEADGKGLGIIIANLDDDHRPDIYVANDGTPNFLFRNLSEPGQLKFESLGRVSGSSVNGAGEAEAGMGVACADFNSDGRLDLYVTNFYGETNTLYLNLGNMLFMDATHALGLAAPSKPVLGFGTQVADLDFDTRLELLVTNGHIDDYRFRHEPWKMPSQLYRQLNEERYIDASVDGGDFFAGRHLGRGVARLDFDRDHAPDFLVVHQDRPVGLLANRTQTDNHRLVVDLRGTTSNRDAIGTRIEVTTGGQKQVLELSGGDGFFTTNERRQWIGLGANSQVDLLDIWWPDGTHQQLRDVPADQLLTCREGREVDFAPLE